MTVFLSFPYHSLVCIALTSQRNNTKQFPAWCLCPPLVYLGTAGACWDQSGQHWPHYCRTRRQAWGRKPHQPPARWYLGRLWFVLYRQNVFVELQQTQCKPQWSYWWHPERCSGLFPCQWDLFCSCITRANTRTNWYSCSIIQQFLNILYE